MGVKDLWSILAPVRKEVPLTDLIGKTIAVDLSVWICENNGVKAVQGRVCKPHLRYNNASGSEAKLGLH